MPGRMIFGRAVQHPLPPEGKVIPPTGMEIPAADRQHLMAAAGDLQKRVDVLKHKSPYWPDVAIYSKAVLWAVGENTVYNQRELAAAYELIDEGTKRADALERGLTPWNDATGLVVRGYVSRIDGSVQPYGLVIPASWSQRGRARYRLDIWFHGRGEQLTELSFLDGRRKSLGDFAPDNVFVLHPYGRFCNANHVAGETDTLEAMADVQRRYRIDDDRITVRGFSMGGGATWHFAVHHADKWAAAAPGAGFSETPDFQRSYSNGATFPKWQVQLWKWYDATDWPTNLSNLPTIAYNGDKDGQKQAADAMEKAMKAVGLELPRVTGPDTGHWYHKDSKPVIETFVTAAANKGRTRNPERVRFTTWTLRYNSHYWVTIHRLKEHYAESLVDATRSASGDRVDVKTKGVESFSLTLDPAPKRVTIDGQTVTSGAIYVNQNGKWMTAAHLRAKRGELVKHHGVQGPVDDAFLDSVIFVSPSGTPMVGSTGAFLEKARVRAAGDWKRFFRGEMPTVADRDLTAKQIAESHIVVWGDPQSNSVLGKVIGKLPIKWDKRGLSVNGRLYGPTEAYPVIVYPNPLNPEKYIVLNSGYTWYEHSAGSNALHTPKLPDWGVVRVADGPQQVLDAGFFDESWQLRKA